MVFLSFSHLICWIEIIGEIRCTMLIKLSSVVTSRYYLWLVEKQKIDYFAFAKPPNICLFQLLSSFIHFVRERVEGYYIRIRSSFAWAQNKNKDMQFKTRIFASISVHYDIWILDLYCIEFIWNFNDVTLSFTQFPLILFLQFCTCETYLTVCIFILQRTIINT